MGKGILSPADHTQPLPARLPLPAVPSLLSAGRTVALSSSRKRRFVGLGTRVSLWPRPGIPMELAVFQGLSVTLRAGFRDVGLTGRVEGEGVTVVGGRMARCWQEMRLGSNETERLDGDLGVGAAGESSQEPPNAPVRAAGQARCLCGSIHAS